MAELLRQAFIDGRGSVIEGFSLDWWRGVAPMSYRPLSVYEEEADHEFIARMYVGMRVCVFQCDWTSVIVCVCDLCMWVLVYVWRERLCAGLSGDLWLCSCTSLSSSGERRATIQKLGMIRTTALAVPTANSTTGHGTFRELHCIS